MRTLSRIIGLSQGDLIMFEQKMSVVLGVFGIAVSVSLFVVHL